MDRIIRLYSDPHSNAEALLPWYVSGQLAAAERAELEAHLSDCAACRAELDVERRLRGEVAGLSLEADLGWERLQNRVGPAIGAGDAGRLPAKRFAHAAFRPRNLALFLGAQAAVLALAIMILPPRVVDAPYHALGAAPADRTGNLIVLFRPDTTETALRGMLNASHASLVDGPTPAGAYVLHVPQAERGSALAMLRARQDIVLAQPIDAGSPR